MQTFVYMYKTCDNVYTLGLYHVTASTGIYKSIENDLTRDESLILVNVVKRFNEPAIILPGNRGKQQYSTSSLRTAGNIRMSAGVLRILICKIIVSSGV
jgi:hypothetical protein